MFKSKYKKVGVLLIYGIRGVTFWVKALRRREWCLRFLSAWRRAFAQNVGLRWTHCVYLICFPLLFKQFTSNNSKQLDSRFQLNNHCGSHTIGLFAFSFNFRWPLVEIPLQKLCDNDNEQDILFQCWHFVQDGSDELIGEAQCTVGNILQKLVL